MNRGITAGLALALALALPAAAEASSVLPVKDGKARRVNDPLLPPVADRAAGGAATCGDVAVGTARAARTRRGADAG